MNSASLELTGNKALARQATSLETDPAPSPEAPETAAQEKSESVVTTTRRTRSKKAATPRQPKAAKAPKTPKTVTKNEPRLSVTNARDALVSVEHVGKTSIRLTFKSGVVVRIYPDANLKNREATRDGLAAWLTAQAGA